MHRRFVLMLAGSAVALAGLFGVAQAQNGQWGDVAGQITWGGPALPVVPPINVAANPDGPACMKNGPVANDLWVVNAKNKGLKNVFVWLEPAKKGDPALPVHPKLKAVPKDGVVMDQPACAFIPHVVALRQGQDLIAKNSSPIAHNFKWTGNPAKNPGGNVLLPPGGEKAIAGLVEERLGITVECNVHPWMKGYVRVFDHPYFAVTDADGNFTIKDAPAGDYRIKYWHGSGGWLGGVAGKDGYPITIKAGANNLPAIAW